MQKVYLFDTTLRDGSQAEGISFTVKDKIKIVKLLDDFGIHYIEGGWPGSNPKDVQFFKEVKNLSLKNSKIVAFSSTRRPNIKIEEDKNIQTLVKAETPAVSIFGKCWDFHVEHALKTTAEENLAMIKDTISYLKSLGREVFFDAEHFFDGYKSNPGYALQCLKTADQSGADFLVLCDTNGGTLPFEIEEIIEKIKSQLSKPLGIHAHNDSDCAVANSVVAVEAGALQIQGTINGYGERCGNANLCSIIPILKLKMKIDCVSDEKLKDLTELARHVSEIANLPQSSHQPFVGRCAFAHKGGIHVSAVLKAPQTYEHIDPILVGNERHVTVSELSGVSNLEYKAKEYGIDLKKGTPEVKLLLQNIKELEHAGYMFEEGEASFELMLKRTLKEYSPFFELMDFKAETIKDGKKETIVHAFLELKVKGKKIKTKASGDGPVNALDAALRKAIEDIYPQIKKVKLTDYKVRVLDSKEGTAAKVRVIIESSDDDSVWGTVGVSTNIIEASWLALVDSLEYKLLKG